MVDAAPRGFLTLPGPNDRTVARLQRKVRLLAVRTLLTAPSTGVGARTARSLQAARRFLSGVLRDDPEALLRAVGSPDVLPSLLCLQSRALPPERCFAAIPGLLARLVALAPEAPLLWEAPIPWLSEGDAGPLHHFDPPAKALLVRRNELELELADGSHAPLPPDSPDGWTRLRPGVDLSTLDTNPLSDLEAHPDKDGNAVDLGGKPLSRWANALGAALDLVDHLPHWTRELVASGVRLVPVGYEPERHLSASYREAPGTVYLTLHPDPLILAEAIVHEVQHGKLNLLTWLDPVLENGHSAWTTSPVRPDLRPLMGVLLAAHAFVPVAALHHALAVANHPVAGTPTFARRRAEVLGTNTRSLEILTNLAQPTATGRRILDALHSTHSALVRAAGGTDLTPPEPSNGHGDHDGAS